MSQRQHTPSGDYAKVPIPNSSETVIYMKTIRSYCVDCKPLTPQEVGKFPAGVNTPICWDCKEKNVSSGPC